MRARSTRHPGPWRSTPPCPSGSARGHHRRILLQETGRLTDAAARTAAEWDRWCRDAERWLLRASMLGGERAIRLAADGSAADVTISYTVTMGVRHPDGATCRIPASATWDGPAMA